MPDELLRETERTVAEKGSEERVMTDMKIAMRTPLVEMDGDEMTRIIWRQIKDILLEPYIDLKTEYYVWALKSETRRTTR
jgi:isocitrate dehydrogenase (NADP) (EC 1.1.1.42)